MKRLLFLPLAVFIALPVLAYDSAINSPVMGNERDTEMLEPSSEFQDSNLNQRDLQQQRMEEQWEMDHIEEQRMEDRSEFDDGINYNDRTRTDRERKALNTGSNASDDQ